MNEPTKQQVAKAADSIKKLIDSEDSDLVNQCDKAAKGEYENLIQSIRQRKLRLKNVNRSSVEGIRRSARQRQK